MKRKAKRKEELEIKLKVKKIEEVYNKCCQKINELAKKQNNIIEEFLEELEKRKIEELKKQINNS